MSSASSTPPPETEASSSAISSGTTVPEERPRQIDPSDPSRTVAYKKANTPYLAHARFKAQEAERRREKRRQKGLPEDGDEEEEPLELPGPRTVLKWLLLMLIAVLAMGQFVTGDVLYGYKGKWRNPKRWIPVSGFATERGGDEVRIWEERADSWASSSYSTSSRLGSGYLHRLS